MTISDGMVTYGIGFGGSISPPIKTKKNNNQETKDLTADQEDISDEMQSLFDEKSDGRPRRYFG